jgi:hypothetical protein
VVGVVSSSRAIARVACVGRLQHDPYPQQLPLLGAAGAQPRLKDRAISRPQPDFHGIAYHAILNHAATPHDSANMTQLLRIVGTRAKPMMTICEYS